MTDPLALLRLLQTSDSAFPSGAFAFSNGLEMLLAEGLAAGAPGVAAALDGQVIPRWFEFDRPVLAAAMEAAPDPAQVDADCEAQSVVAPLAQASRRIGRGLLTTHARIGTPGAAAYLARLRQGQVPGHAPVAQGLVAAGLGLPRALAEAGALHALVAGHASAAVRLGAIGALEAQEMLTRSLAAAAPRLRQPPPRRPSAFCPLAEIAAMRRGVRTLSLFAT